MLTAAPSLALGRVVFVVPKFNAKSKLNRWTNTTTLDLALLESQLTSVQDATWFASYDVLSGFD